MPDLCVVIPMKDPVFSKQRLSCLSAHLKHSTVHFRIGKN